MHLSAFIKACLQDLKAKPGDEPVELWRARIAKHPDREAIAAHLLVVLLDMASAGHEIEVRRIGVLVFAAFDSAAAVERALNRTEIGRRAKQVLAGIGTNPTELKTSVAAPKPTGVGMRTKR